MRRNAQGRCDPDLDCSERCPTGVGTYSPQLLGCMCDQASLATVCDDDCRSDAVTVTFRASDGQLVVTDPITGE